MLGTRQRYSASTVDQMPRHVAAGYVFGTPVAVPVPDLDRTDYLVVLGANPYASNGSLCTAPDFPGRIEAMQARGGKLVVVDPRRSRTAEQADEWLPIRPGSDALLLAAIANTLFDEGLADPGPHVAEHLAGLDDVRAGVAPFTPEAVEAATGIDAATIRRLARELAAAFKIGGIHRWAHWSCDDPSSLDHRSSVMAGILTHEQKQLAFRLRARGWRLVDIAREIGCTAPMVGLMVRDGRFTTGVPDQWEPRSGCLGIAEREEILVGIRAGESLTVDRPPARTCRPRRSRVRSQPTAAGSGYSAWRAHQRARDQARRPKPCKLRSWPAAATR